MKLSVLLLLPIFLTANVLADSAFKVHNRFGNHMVLQQGKETILQGSATAGSQIKVEFAGESLSAKTDENGHWQVALPILEASSEPKTLLATTGKKSYLFSDILVGEVWMCSGQSNMARSLSNTANADLAADFPQIRLFNTSLGTAMTPEADVAGKWELCTPDTVKNFSAVGYLFGKELAENLDVPIGLIGTAWGGKPVEAFTSAEGIKGEPAAEALAAEWNERDRSYDATKAKANYEKALENYEAKLAEMKESGSKDRRPKQPSKPSRPLLDPGAPSAIYNTVIAPWSDYAIAGAIWYQGESNRFRAQQYESLFPALIRDWRTQWDDDFPFYFVQLAQFREQENEPASSSIWAELQNAQRLTLDAVDNTGMAVANDIGDPEDIHPADKSGVAHRLALLALGKT